MTTMARVLTHPRVFPLVSPGSHHESKENRKPKRCVKMMYTLQAPMLRIQTITGLRACNALNLMSRSGQIFFSKVNLSISSHKGRARRCVTKAFFERCTKEAFNVIVLAEEEAARLGHNHVGTEQILLGLIREETGIAGKFLTSMGINLNDTRIEVENIIGRGSDEFVAAEVIQFTPLARRVLEFSHEEAKQLGPNYSIGTEHILLGILSKGEGVGARVLENLGADPSHIRTQVIRMVEENKKKQTL